MVGVKEVMTTEKNNLRIYQISHSSKYDGSGTRVVIFFQGCNSNCIWCHSPHSKLDISPLLYNERFCIGCKRCVEVCDYNVHSFSENKHIIDRSKCSLCGNCIDVCPNSSYYSHSNVLTLPTKNYQVAELYKLIDPSLQIIKNKGGITLSGGEALLQLEGVAELLKLCKYNGISTAVETSGLLSISHYKRVDKLVDSWLLGLRIITNNSKTTNLIHMNKIVKLLKSFNSEILLRYPVIPNYTDTRLHLNLYLNVMKNHKINSVFISPFNKDTDHYYDLSGSQLQFEMPSNNLQKQSYDKVVKFFIDNGISCLDISNY